MELKAGRPPPVCVLHLVVVGGVDLRAAEKAADPLHGHARVIPKYSCPVIGSRFAITIVEVNKLAVRVHPGRQTAIPSPGPGVASAVRQGCDERGVSSKSDLWCIVLGWKLLWEVTGGVGCGA